MPAGALFRPLLPKPSINTPIIGLYNEACVVVNTMVELLMFAKHSEKIIQTHKEYSVYRVCILLLFVVVMVIGFRNYHQRHFYCYIGHILLPYNNLGEIHGYFQIYVMSTSY